MKNLSKYTWYIVSIALVIMGAILAIVINQEKLKGGLACVCWGCAILIISAINYFKQRQDLIAFDEDAREVLEDIATKGPDSEYYHFYNIDIVNKKRAKFVKMQNKQTIGCVAVGIILLITGFVCML